jgi:impB/mucB/samB family
VSNYPIPALSLRWLYVDFNSYFASVEQQLRPELRGKPVAVVPVETDSTCAIAASYEAKAFGVKTGTRIYEARRLCPGLICVLAQHERYVEFHHRLIEEIERHIPVTAVCSIDEVACRLLDNEISVERSTEIAQSIKNGIAKKYRSLYALLDRHCAEPLSRKSRNRAAKAGRTGGPARGGFAAETFHPKLEIDFESSVGAAIVDVITASGARRRKRKLGAARRR